MDDGSTDETYEIAKELRERDKRVKLLQHENGANLGAGVSRNTGIKESKSEFISFLDADDLYLSNRFDKALEILKKDINVDAVYEVLGVHYSDKRSKIKHVNRMTKAKKNIPEPVIPVEFTGVEKKTKPEDLFYHLIINDRGWIHLDCLTIRKSSLNNFALFNNDVIGEDSDFIMRLSCERKVVGSGSLEPVATRGVHGANRITDEDVVRVGKQTTSWERWLHYSLKNKRRDVITFVVMRCADDGSILEKAINIVRVLVTVPFAIPSFLRGLLRYYSPHV